MERFSPNPLSARRGQWAVFVAMAAGFAFLVRIVLAMWYANSFDTEWYLMWAADMQHGFWNCYDGHVRQLDYPPLYLFLLRPVGALLRQDWIANYMPTRMLLIKFWPVLGDTLIVPAVYLLFRRDDETAAALAACAWAINPSAIFNCSCWGQTDGIMTLLMLVTFAAFHREKPRLGTFLFAVACLTKMQCLYFAPVILCWFLRRKQTAQLWQSLGIGFGTVIAVFLPFTIASRNPLAIFEVYFGGFGKYPYVNLNAFNLWGLGNFNWVLDSTKLLGFLPYSVIGTLLMLGSFAAAAGYCLRAPRPNIWLQAALLMQCLFVLTTRQHERYQFIVMILLLAAYLTLRDGRLLKLFGGVTLVTFANQAALLSKNIHQDAPWYGSFRTVQVIGSAANLALFAWMIAVFLSIAREGGKELVHESDQTD